ncbi:MAG: pitrilysin family protein [Gemmatimonadales bacterium]
MNHFTLQFRRTTTLVAATLGAATSGLSAQVTTAPALGATPTLTVPAVQEAVLPNGLRLMVVRNAEVPLVEARLILDGGARLNSVAPGIAAFAATMLSEGAGSRTALQFSEASDFIGARLGAGAGWENTTLTLSVPKRSVTEGFGLLADMLLRPSFHAADVKRERDLRLAALLRAKDSPSQVAQRVFFRNVYPANHPLHRDIGGDSASTAALDSVGVRTYWQRAADPRRATLILSGDVTLAEARLWATKAMGSWKAPTTALLKPAAATVAAAPSTATHIILVDKPDAAQSVVFIGAPGMSRTNPDYAAVQVMSTILGGSFSSRLNDILREQLGYTYGAGAGFSFAPVTGPFLANSAVRTNVTDSSLIVFFRELKKIGAEPVSPLELTRARNYLVLGSLGDYETAGQVAGALSTALLFHQPLAAQSQELAAIGRVTAADVQRVAKAHIDTGRLTVVIVGDVAKIRPGIEKLKLGPIEVQSY